MTRCELELSMAFSDLPHIFWNWVTDPAWCDPLNREMYPRWLWSLIQPGKPFEVV